MTLPQLQAAPPEATATWLTKAPLSNLFTPHAPLDPFAATTRLLHPATDTDGNPATWTQVAAHTGHRLHPASTWNDVSATVHTRRSTRSDWPGGEPDLGELGEPGWDTLLEHLTHWSGPEAACVVAVDEDLPWVRGGTHVGFYGDPHHAEPAQEPAFPAQVLTTAPRVELLRTCLLLSGPLAAVPTLGRTWRYQYRRWFERHGPTALWSSDRSWLVLTDLDADCTLVAGPGPLIDAVSADTRLDVRPRRVPEPPP